MKKDSSKYIFILVLSCLAFMFIDNVSAATKSVNISTYGEKAPYVRLYVNNTAVATSTFTGNHAIEGGLWHSISVPSNISLVNSSVVHEFNWYSISYDKLKDYDSVSFTIGSAPGYVNTMQFWISGTGYDSNWTTCTPISLPGSTSTHINQFSSFTCSYDKSLITSGSYTIYVRSFITGPIYQNTSGDTLQFLQPQFIFSNNAVFYTADENAVVNSIKEQTEAINNQTQSINDMKDMDIPDSSKELPDDSSFNNYEDAEGALVDKIKEADMSVIDPAIDINSSHFIWDTITRSIQTHPKIFGMFISILSIGIIKLALGR